MSSRSTGQEVYWTGGDLLDRRRSTGPEEIYWTRGGLLDRRRSTGPEEVYWTRGGLLDQRRSTGPEEVYWTRGGLQDKRRSTGPEEVYWTRGGLQDKRRSTGQEEVYWTGGGLLSPWSFSVCRKLSSRAAAWSTFCFSGLGPPRLSEEHRNTGGRWDRLQVRQAKGEHMDRLADRLQLNTGCRGPEHSYSYTSTEILEYYFVVWGIFYCRYENNSIRKVALNWNSFS